MAALARLPLLAARAARVALPLLARGFAAVQPDAVLRKGAAGAVKGSKKKEATDLASVLERELAYEKEDPTSEATLADIASSMSDFTVTDVAGHARFFMTRARPDGQEVRLDVDCSPVPDDEADMEPEGEEGEEGGEGAEGEEPAPPEGYRVLVTIRDAAKGTTMQAGAFCTDHLRIHRVTLYKSGSEPTANQVFGGFDEMPTYSGPAFDELDNALQNAFYEFLADRGVDDGLAEKISDYCSTKEQIEYVRWLESAKNFAA